MFKMRAKMITVGLLGTAAMLPLDHAKADQVGHASWYALHSRTASGEQMNPQELTAAHRSLPFGTRVLVQNLSNGRTVVVRINDRGPFIGGRIIDLSKAAAESIGMIDSGTAKVRVISSGGNAVAALGEAASKAKDGAAVAAVANLDLRSDETSPKVKAIADKRSASNSKVVGSLRYAKTKTVASRSHAKSKAVASKASSKTRYAAKGHHTHVKATGMIAESKASSKTRYAAKGQHTHVKATGMIAEKSSHSTKRAAKLAAKASAKTFAVKSAGPRGHARMASAWNPYHFSTKHRAS
jgi:rare lipoprotein A